MAILIFTIVNGLGVVFLLYVLVQFWKEGHRSNNRGMRQYAIKFSEENGPEVSVSSSARAGHSVIPIRARKSGVEGRQLHVDSADRTREAAITRFSTR
jgi:hypothetical protein